MNSELKERVRAFVENKSTFEAVKYVFTDTIEKNKPEVHDQNSNNILGQKYRAYDTAKKLLESCFDELALYEGYKKEGADINKGR